MAKNVATVEDFEKLKNADTGLVPMSFLVPTITERKGDIRGAEPGTALRWYNDGLAEPLKKLSAQPAQQQTVQVDPDAERDGERGSPGGGKTLRMLIKMDVQFLGAFDVIVNARDKNVVLQLACPEQVAVFSKEITAAMNDILKRNGLQPSTIQVAAMRRPVAISEVFPKLFERGFGVNVKI